MTSKYLDRVRVFYNATRHCYSVKAYNGKAWRLSHHTDSLTLKQVKFIVNETTRQRVIAEGKKYEHAFIEGIISQEKEFYDGKSIYYNPYKTSQFMADCQPINECNEVSMVISKVIITDGNKYAPVIIAK